MRASLKEQKTEKEQVSKGKEAISQQLFRIVCETYVLFAKTQGYHWNVTGPQFHSLHQLFESQYKDLFEAIDVLAERVRALDTFAPSSLQDMVKNSSLPDQSRVPLDEEMIRDLLKSHEQLAKTIKSAVHLCEEIDDDATGDILISRLESHDKAAWMLRSSL